MANIKKSFLHCSDSGECELHSSLTNQMPENTETLGTLVNCFILLVLSLFRSLSLSLSLSLSFFKANEM